MQSLIGCFNRPWNRYELDDALGGIADAGFRYFGLLTQHRTQLVSADAISPQQNAPGS